MKSTESRAQYPTSPQSLLSLGSQYFVQFLAQPQLPGTEDKGPRFAQHRTEQNHGLRSLSETVNCLVSIEILPDPEILQVNTAFFFLMSFVQPARRSGGDNLKPPSDLWPLPTYLLMEVTRKHRGKKSKGKIVTSRVK